jgi:hypothetical protein
LEAEEEAEVATGEVAETPVVASAALEEAASVVAAQVVAGSNFNIIIRGCFLTEAASFLVYKARGKNHNVNTPN